MITFFIGLLTILLVLNCLLLILLVLVQLPKKEAGAGMAFGGAATDALFGAGSGNALTKITKYVAGGFFGLALILSVLMSHHKRATSTGVLDELRKGGTAAAVPVAPAPVRAPAETPMLLTNQIVTTNLPAATNQ